MDLIDKLIASIILTLYVVAWAYCLSQIDWDGLW